MNTMKQVSAIIGGGVLFLTAVLVLYFFGLTDPNGRPYCHKAIDLAFHNWQDINGTERFPNINGNSKESLAVISPDFGNRPLHDTYMYVPGLQRDDPGDLVLMYVRQPTRWIWHGQRPTIFHDMAWILVPVDMKFHGPDRAAGPGEFSERVSFHEFRRRLVKTLKYLEENERPNWRAVVKEHTQFLDSL